MSIADALKEAQAKAAASTPASTLPATTPAASVPVAAGPRMGAGDFMNNSRSSVDSYLKVSEHGLTIGTDTKNLIEGFDAIIDCAKLKFCSQVRFGKPPQYFKTYDGRRTADGSGKAWTETLALAKSVDNSRASDPYSTAEMVIEVAGPVKNVKDQDVGTKLGTKLGYTPPYTGAPQLQELLAMVQNEGGDIERSKVNVKVGYEAQSRNNNNWGIVTFQFVSLVEAVAEAA